MRKTTRRRFSYEKFQAQEEGATVMEGGSPHKEYSSATRFHRNNSTATAIEWEPERAQTPPSHRPIQQTGTCHQHLTFQSSASYRNYE
jgi:Flp pilus assembly pilin Flp